MVSREPGIPRSERRPPAITVFGFDYPEAALGRLASTEGEQQTQTRLFARRLTLALRSATGLPIRLVSAAPIPDFPASPILFVRPLKKSPHTTEEGTVSVRGIAYVNWGPLKVASRLATSLAEAIRLSVSQSGGYVCVYSMHVPFMASGLLMARLSRSTSVGIWTDPPAVALRDSAIEFRIRSLENRVARWLARRFDKVVAVTEDLASDFAPEAPSLVVEALAEEEERPQSDAGPSGPTVFTYTGGVSRRYGLAALSEAVLALPYELNVVLDIYGSGDYVEEILRLSRTSDRIRYRGVVTHEEALAAQAASDFLINARDPGDAFTRYSFPSKTLEYLGSGTPVLTTVLPGIPAPYWNYLLKIESASVDAIARAMAKAMAIPAELRSEIGARGSEFARTRGYRSQGSKIWDFMSATGVRE